MDPNAGTNEDRRRRRSARLRFLWDRDGRGCFYCRCPLTEEEATFDHSIPRVEGGPNALHNLRVACSPCNQAKGHALPDASLRWMRDIAPKREPSRLAFLLGEVWPT